MRSARSIAYGVLLAGLIWASIARGREMVVRERVRLRQGPTTSSEQLGGSLLSGTRVEVLEEEGGWLKVQTPDGRSGYVWGEQLTQIGNPTRAPDAVPRAEPASATLDAILTEVRALRTEVDALSARPEGASAADVERVRIAVEQLAEAERELGTRLHERGPLPPASDPLPWARPGLLAGIAIGTVALGLVILGISQRRRAAQRYRLKL